jgi:hypothetical protein
MSGSRLIAAVLMLGAGWLGFAAAKKHQPGTYAVVAGTVFKDPGFALPDANVTLTLRDDPKAKKMQQEVTTPRGEFSFQVPAAPATYVVKASLRGFRPDQKEAAISGEDRVEVTLTLVPESK